MTVTDLQKFPREDWHSRTVADAMTPASRLHTLAPDDLLSRASELIAANNVNQLPVIDEDHLLGFVTRAGIMRMLQLRDDEGDAVNVESSKREAKTSRMPHPSGGIQSLAPEDPLGPEDPVT